MESTKLWRKRNIKNDFSILLYFAIFCFSQEFPGFFSPGSVFLWHWCVFLPLQPKQPSLRSLWTPTSHQWTSTPSSQVIHIQTQQKHLHMPMLVSVLQTANVLHLNHTFSMTQNTLLCSRLWQRRQLYDVSSVFVN